MKSSNSLTHSAVTRILLLVVLIFSGAAVLSAQQNGNVLYTLAAGEEFVHGRMGLHQDGSIRYTFAVVRVSDPEKTVYRREFEPYGPQPLLRGGSMPVERNVQDYDRYDYYIIFNGQKMGPFDRFMDLNQSNPNIDDWVSPDGSTITFAYVQGQRYTAWAGDGPLTGFWSHVQVPMVAEAPGKVAFAIQAGNRSWNLFENRRVVHRDWKRISNVHYSADGSKLLYVGAPENSEERYVYVNHTQVAGPYSTVGVNAAGFLDGTNIPYYLGATRSTVQNTAVYTLDLTVGDRKVAIPPNTRNVTQLSSLGNKIAFQGQVDDDTVFFVYDAGADELTSFGGFSNIRDIFRERDTLYCSGIDERNNAVLISHTGDVLARLPQEERGISSVRFQVSPGGDVYAYFQRADGRMLMEKNGAAFAPAGTDFAAVRHFSFNPRTGEPRIALMLDSFTGEQRRIILGNRVIDLEGSMDNFQLFSAFSSRGNDFYWVKRHIISHGVRGDWRWELHRNTESVSQIFHGFAGLVVSDDGNRHAALVSDSPEYTVTRYNSVNSVMHQRMQLFVDGTIVPGNFGAPVWCEQTRSFKAIAQDGNNLVVRRF